MIKTKPKITNEDLARRLGRIEDLLVQILPTQIEMTEEELIKIIKQGDEEYLRGETEDFDTFIAREHPNLVGR